MKTIEEVIEELKYLLYDRNFSKKDYLENTKLWNLIKEIDIGKENIRLYSFFDGFGTPGFINNYAKYAININYDVKYIIEDEEESVQAFMKIVNEFKDKAVSEKKKELNFEGPFEILVSTKKRREQKLLRNQLFNGKDIGECAICGEKVPIKFLVAAHVKKRAAAEENEKRDTQIVVPMCKFGCDDLFENGYISVKNGLVIRVSSKEQVLTRYVEHYIDKILGRECAYWNKHTQKYFEWHISYHSTKEQQ